MDEKDSNEEELNPQGQDDINDADDSFGLPDLEYKPLEDDSEESDSDEAEAGDDSTTSNTEEEPNDSSDAEDSNDNYSYESDDAEETEDNESEAEEGKSELRYQIEDKGSNTPKIIGGIIGVLVVSVAIWYFGFYGPQQTKIAEAEKAKQEEIDKKAAADADELKRQQAAAVAAAVEEARLAAEADALAKAGIQILDERTSRYYIVLESFIDEDFAKDFGNKIAKEGTPSFLIPPYSKKKMQRVGIGGYESIDEAKTALNDLSDEFGKGKWILKY
jgi:cell division protein FtsN